MVCLAKEAFVGGDDEEDEGMINISNTILILGAIYLHLAYGLSYIFALGLVVFGLAMWAYHSGNEQKKKLLEAQTDALKAKAEWYRRRKA